MTTRRRVTVQDAGDAAASSKRPYQGAADGRAALTKPPQGSGGAARTKAAPSQLQAENRKQQSSPWAIIAVTAGVALAVTAFSATCPLLATDTACRYAPMAEAFAAGNWAEAFHPRFGVGMSVVAGLFRLLFGLDGYAACSGAAALGWALGILPLFRIAERVFDRRTAWFAVVLYLLCPQTLLWTVKGLREPFKLLGVLATADALLGWAKGEGRRTKSEGRKRRGTLPVCDLRFTILNCKGLLASLVQFIRKSVDRKSEIDDSALRPSPFTLHPSPFTLHPSPFTLHPSPFALLEAMAGLLLLFTFKCDAVLLGGLAMGAFLALDRFGARGWAVFGFGVLAMQPMCALVYGWTGWWLPTPHYVILLQKAVGG